VTEVRVAFQGEPGAYGDDAIVARWQNGANAIPSRTFEDVVSGVALGRADFGILAVWNSIFGDIAPGCAAVGLGRNTPHGLAVLHADIQDVPDSVTQSLVPAPQAERRNAFRRHASGEAIRW
jgi:hypothetical protein